VDEDWKVYVWGFWIVGIITFLATWAYAISTYGFFLGVGLGWIPAAVIGALAGALWPLLLFGGALLALYLFHPMFAPWR